MYDDVRYETDGGIATITMDRPDVYNAFTDDMVLEVNDAIRRANDDDGVYVVVLTGAGNGFCAGADVTGMGGDEERSFEDGATSLWKVQHVPQQLRQMAKPSIAAINGPAIGAGMDWALGCDLRTIAPDAIMREGFVRVGLISGDGGGWLLPRLIGESKAKEYLLTGKDMSAEEAEDLGLVVEVADDALEAAYDLAGDLLDLPALAVRNMNRLIDPDQTFEDYCERAIAYQRECRLHPEQDEAVAAFLEKREPVYERDYS